MMSTATLWTSKVLAGLLLLWRISAIPVTHIIQHSGMECLYDTVTSGEYVTVSLFISTGDTFKAPLFFEGPFLPLDDKSPPNAQKIINSANDPHHWDQVYQHWTNHWGSSNGLFREHMFADFEDVTDDYYNHEHGHEEDHEDEGDDHYEEGLMDDQYYNDVHDEDTDDIHSVLTEDDQMAPEQREEVRKENERRASLTSEQKEEERRKRAEERRVIQEDMKKDREERRKKYEARIKEKEEKKKRKMEEKQNKPHKLKSGQPFLKTFHVTDSGWYRFCVTAENGQVGAYIDSCFGCHSTSSSFHSFTLLFYKA